MGHKQVFFEYYKPYSDQGLSSSEMMNWWITTQKWKSVIIYLFKLACFCKTQKKIFWKMLVSTHCPNNGSQWKRKLFGYQHSSKYLILHSIKSYKFETTSGWVNDDRIWVDCLFKCLSCKSIVQLMVIIL